MSMTLTTNTHVLNDVRHVDSLKIFDDSSAYDILVEENSNQSLLVNVVLAVQNAVDHQPT